MKQDEIKGLTYAQLKKEIKTIEICLNNNFKNRTITVDQLYWELNFLLYNVDIHCDDYLEILVREGKYIGSTFQNFYFKIDKSCFNIMIKLTEINGTISNIKIRLLN